MMVIAGLTLLALVVGGLVAWRAYQTGVGQLEAAHRQLSIHEASTALETLNTLASRWDSHILIRARRLINGASERVIRKGMSESVNQKRASESVIQLIDEYEGENRYDYFVLMALFGYFEELGFLCEIQPGSDDPVTQYVMELFKGPVKYYYGLFENFIKREQASQSLPDEEFGTYFQKLAQLVGNGENEPATAATPVE